MCGISMAVVVACAIQFSAWQTPEDERGPCFVIPSEVVFVATAHQADSPLEFVGGYAVGFLNGGWKTVYKVRNRGTKPIRGYTVAIVSSEGTGGEESVTMNYPAHYFSPEQTWFGSSRDQDLDIVPLTHELREKHLKGGMRSVLILVIVRVEFGDGTVYSGESAYESLRKFFNENSIIPEDEATQKGKRR